MRDNLINFYNKLIKKYKDNNFAELKIYTIDEFCDSEDYKIEKALYNDSNEELKSIVYSTPAYYSSLSKKIYVFIDCFDQEKYKDLYVNKLSKELVYSFILAHEFRHNLQRKYDNSFLSNVILMEKRINNYNADVHDELFEEIDANLFAARELGLLKYKYKELDLDYIECLNLVYSADYDYYDYDSLINNYIVVIKENNNLLSDRFKKIFDEYGNFKNIGELINNSIDNDFLNIIVTSSAFLKNIKKEELSENDKKFINNEINKRKEKLNEVNVDNGRIDYFTKKIGIKVIRNYNYELIENKMKELDYYIK